MHFFTLQCLYIAAASGALCPTVPTRLLEHALLRRVCRCLCVLNLGAPPAPAPPCGFVDAAVRGTACRGMSVAIRLSVNQLLRDMSPLSFTQRGPTQGTHT
jgi:hypothetical protein